MQLKFLDRPFVHLILIALLGLIAYSNTFNVPFQLDDGGNIVENPIIKDLGFYIDPSSAEKFTGPVEYPMLKSRYVGSLTFALNYWVHGLDVRGYHVVNLAIHVVNALLVYWLVLLTFKTPLMKESSLKSHIEKIALFSGLLFVTHPIQTQAVTYIVQRFSSLATLFCLFSLVLYVRCRLYGTLNSKSVALYALALVSAVLAMKTKEIAFVLPVIAVLYEFLFFGGPIKKRCMYLVPILLTMLIIPFTVLGTGTSFGGVIGDVGEATRLQTEMSRADYLFTQFRVIATYIRLLFLPINQNLDYDYPIFDSFLNPQVFMSILFLLSILGLGVYLLQRSRSSEPALKLVAFGIFWFFVALSVESSMIPIVDVIFEHRAYLSSAGFLTAAATGCFLILKACEKERLRKTGIAALCLLPLILSSATYARNKVWRSEISLWEDVVRKSPQKARGHDHLCLAYYDKGLNYKAINHCQTALVIQPDYANVHYNLALAFRSEGMLDKAIEHFQLYMKINADDAEAHNELGVTYGMKGQRDKALIHFQITVRLDPQNASAYHNIGTVYKKMGFLEKASEYFQKEKLLKEERQ